MSKVKCFNYHDHGKYAINFPQKKNNNKKAPRVTTGEALASQVELDFSLITCMVSNVMGSMWYLDSGAYFCITGNKVLFSSLEENDLQMHIEMGDDERYIATALGTVTF